MSEQQYLSPPQLLFFQEMRSGDLKKQRAESHRNPHSGGGARDLRVPLDYESVLAPMFPEPGSEAGVRSGVIHWTSPSGPESASFELWPPTEARPTELRVARIHELHGWAVDEEAYNRAQASGHKWFYALEKRADGTVQARIIKHEALDSERPELRTYLLERIRRTPPTRSVRGTIDFQTRGFYP